MDRDREAGRVWRRDVPGAGGEVRVRFVIEGRETALVTLNAGDFFGKVALFDLGQRSADVLANTDAVLLKVSASAFQKLSHSAPPNWRRRY